jgi:radical SAM protein with 4Fe4S-binding SPASM domain
MEAALDRVALEAGETIAAPRRAPVAFRREGCGCALGHHLHLRSDGALFSCFKMEEPVGHLRGGGFAAAVASVREAPHPAAALSACRDCPLRTLCGGGCRSENLLLTGDVDVPACGPWRPAVIAALLAEHHVTALHWPAPHLLAEAHRRGIPAPERLALARPSLHCTP